MSEQLYKAGVRSQLSDQLFSFGWGVTMHEAAEVITVGVKSARRSDLSHEDMLVDLEPINT
jgi:hypothetical protein